MQVFLLRNLSIRTVAKSLAIFAVLFSVSSGDRASGGFIDAINPNAVTEPRTEFASLVDLGWYYTPTQSYNLTGISSYFLPIDFGSGARTMTVQIRSDLPANGGAILGQGTVVGDSATGGIIGASFSPVSLVAGTTYFVDFLNVNGMGIDLGQWTTVNGVHVPTAGATTRLAGFYEDGGDASFSTARLGISGDQTNALGNASGAEPILFFSGTTLATVPEPSSLLLLGIGVVGASWKLRRRR